MGALCLNRTLKATRNVYVCLLMLVVTRINDPVNHVCTHPIDLPSHDHHPNLDEEVLALTPQMIRWHW